MYHRPSSWQYLNHYLKSHLWSPCQWHLHDLGPRAICELSWNNGRRGGQVADCQTSVAGLRNSVAILRKRHCPFSIKKVIHST